MPIVPSGNVVKSIAVGSPYSPVLSFNPDKKELFKTEGTTLGLLWGDCTTNGTEVTVPSGLTFIQNGIVVRLTSNFMITIPGGGFPKYVVANNDNENAGSPVTIEILDSATPPDVMLARLGPDASTITSAPKISIRGLHDRIEMVGQTSSGIEVLQDNTTVKAGVSDLNFIGPNIVASDGGGDQVDVTVNLDIEEDSNLVTSETKVINFEGPGVSVTADPDANSAKVTIDPEIEILDSGVPLGPVKKLNFSGSGVAVSINVDQKQANIDVSGSGADLADQWVSQVGQFGEVSAQDSALLGKSGIYSGAFFSTSGGAVVSLDSTGLALGLTTGVAQTTQAMLFTGSVHRRDTNPALLTRWRMGPNTAAHRLFIGFTDQTASSMVSSNNPPGHYAGLIKGTVDTVWSFVSKNGTTQNKQASSVAVDSLPHYVRIKVDNSVPNILVEIYDDDFELQDSFTFTSELPNETVPLSLVMAIENNEDGLAKDLYVYYGRGMNAR